MDMLITLHLSEQPVLPMISSISIRGGHFGQTALLIIISTLSIKMLIHVTLTYPEIVREHHISCKRDTQ